MRFQSIPGLVVALAWLATLIAAWSGYGRFLGYVVEGNNPALLSRLQALPTVLLQPTQTIHKLSTQIN